MIEFPRSLMIPVDGSREAMEALRCAQTFSPNAQIHLVHCFTIPQLSYPGTGMSVGHEFTQAAEKALREEGTQILERSAAIVAPWCTQIFQHLEQGDPASVILSLAKEHSAGLIIIGSRGLGGFREHMLGSVSHRVVHQAKCPTLVIQSPLPSVKDVLLPIEQGPDAKRLVDFLSQKPFAAMPGLTVLHVIPFSQPYLPTSALLPGSWQKDLKEGGKQFIQGVMSDLKGLGYHVEGVLETGAPSRVIQDQVAAVQPQLIIMGTHSRSGIQRWIYGSVSHSTVHHSPCPVLVVPPVSTETG